MYGRQGNPYASMMQKPPQRAPAMSQQPMGGGAAPYGRRVQAQGLQRPQARPEEQKKSGGGGMMDMASGMMGGMMSDRHSKEQIQKLEGANEALTQALGQRAEYPDTSAPSSGMRALGQQAPSQASFADAPSVPAETVAAQNEAIKRAAPVSDPWSKPIMDNSGRGVPPAGGPRPSPFGATQAPDMAALDEAYRRIGASPGPT